MKVRFELRLSYLFLVSIVALSAMSCTAYKKVPYLQTKDNRDEINLHTLIKESPVRFRSDDVLSITFNTPGEQGIAYDYNLPLQPAATNPGDLYLNTGTGRQTFLVNKDGEIDIPVLGIVKVEGYTQSELEAHLKTILKRQLKIDPVVTVRLMNFKINVIGEVNRPGSHSITDKGHLNILEALSLAGDMTLYGSRDNVFVIRAMPNGELKRVRLDISKSEITLSPYFYLQQNDIVYVMPSKLRAQTADVSPTLGTVLSVGSFVMAITVFCLSFVK